MQKIIHTSDWHLGQRLDGLDRSEEHLAFLNWLLALIREEEAEGLLVCGDIFDSANPPVSAIRQFTGFIASARSCCPNIALIAGNHDSAGRLDSLQPLLNALGVISVGSLPNRIADCIFPFKNRDGRIFARLACLPYLRTTDLPPYLSDDAPDDALRRIVVRSVRAYRVAGENLCSQRTGNEALFMTGHLFVQGALPTEGERAIQYDAGKLIGIPASAFHPEIDYVALGHLHRGQQIRGASPIYYSGSPIPLSFGEVGYAHHVRIISVNEQNRIADIGSRRVPRTAGMHDLSGNFTDVRAELIRLAADCPASDRFGAIVRVSVDLEDPMPGLRQQILDCVADSGVRVLSVRRSGSPSGPPATADQPLEEFLPLDIFRLKYQSEYPGLPSRELECAFNDLLETTLRNMADMQEERLPYENS